MLVIIGKPWRFWFWDISLTGLIIAGGLIFFGMVSLVWGSRPLVHWEAGAAAIILPDMPL